MSICVKCKRDGWWAIECPDCLAEEIKKTYAEILQLEAIKRELETKMAAELAKERSMLQSPEYLRAWNETNGGTCIRCGLPRNIQNIPWCEKCLRADGLQIPDQKPEQGKQRRWCSIHTRLENGPPWECFPNAKGSLVQMEPSVERASTILHAVKYQVPDGPMTDKDKEFIESEIRRRFPQ